MVERIENLVTIDNIVNGTYMPSSKNRLLTDVILKEGFHIRGGLYANQLTIEGAGTVEGPVMAKRDVIIQPPTDMTKRIHLCCGLSSRLAISVQVPDTEPKTPVGTPGFLPLFIRGDVISESVSIENAVVIGNIYAKNATIKDSIIIGCPLIENRLVMRNAMVISFRAGSVELVKRNSLWVPYGLVESDITFVEDRRDQEEEIQKKVLSSDGETKAPEANKAWLRYLGLCRTKPYGCGKSYWFHCNKYLLGECNKEDVRMTEHDIVYMKRGNKTLKAITVAPRFIDLNKVKVDLEEMVKVVTRALYFEHYYPTSQNQIRRELDQKRNKDTGLLEAHDQFLEEVAKFDIAAGRERGF